MPNWWDEEDLCSYFECVVENLRVTAEVFACVLVYAVGEYVNDKLYFFSQPE